MEPVNRYGPSVVLALVALAALLGGPFVMRELAYAEQRGQVEEARDRLQSGPLLELNQAFRAVAKAVEPSVVHISVRRKIALGSRGGGPLTDPDRPGPFRLQPRPEGPDEYNEFNVPREVGNGSGWVYQHTSGKKYIVTNNHVVESADEIVAVFFDKSTTKATIVNRDPQTDIAVLEIEDQGLLHPVKLVEKPVEQGEIVFAFGSPLHFEFSMSQGIISGDSRRLGILDTRDPVTGRRVQSGYEDFIQTDAAINPGNSGGPLVNVYGEVVGMNSAIASPTGFNSGIGFAIPHDMIRYVVTQIVENGKVRRGYLGIYFQPIDAELARTYGYEGTGVIVNRLAPDSPAAGAGLKANDIIARAEGQPVRSGDELRELVARTPPGKGLKLTIFRDGQTQDVEVTLGEQPAEMAGLRTDPKPEPGETAARAGEIESLRKLGFERLVTMTPELAAALKRDEESRGVLIQEVRLGSIAFSKDIRSGMVITHVQGDPVQSVEELTAAIGKADLKKGVRFHVDDGAGSFQIALSLPE